MSGQDTCIDHIELAFPVEFLRRAISNSGRQEGKRRWVLRNQEPDRTDRPLSDVETSFRREGKPDVEGNETIKENSDLLVLSIKRFVLHLDDGIYKCSFSELVQDEGENSLTNVKERNVATKCTQTVDDLISDEISSKSEIIDGCAKQDSVDSAIPKRKRGRPRKSLADKTNSSEVQRSQSTSELPAEVEEPRRRYGLRGVKLSKSILLAEKGIYPSERSPVKDSTATESQSVKADDNEDHDEEQNLDENSLQPSKQELMDVEEWQSDGSESTYGGKRVKRRRGRRKNPNKTAVFRTRKNGKIDLGDVPKFERRKRNNDRTAECKFCKKLLCDYTGVDEHVRKFHMAEEDIDTYLDELKKLKVTNCETCGQSFPSRHQLQSHQDREHRQNVAVVCNRCGITCKNISSLRCHIKIVHMLNGVKTHLCHLCPAKFKWAATLKQHIEEIHEGKKYVECQICRKTFYRASQLRRHERIHGLDESKRLYCSVCGKSFLFQCNLDRHMKAVHEPQIESFHCSYCGKGFNRKTGMVSHVQLVHFNLFPFSCQECKAKFPRSKMLKDHMYTAHQQSNYEVTENPKERFKYNKSSDDLFYCSYCTHCFHYKAKLVEHMHGAHSDAFPCICTICNQGFLEASFLIKHRKKAHGITDESVETKTIAADDLNAKRILKVVTGRSGAASQVVCLQTAETIADTEQIETTQESEEPGADEQVTGQALDQLEVELPASPGTGGTPILVEVASGSNTYRYYIQAPDDVEGGGPANMEDIANLLLAAEQTIQNTETGDQSEVEISTENVTIVEDSREPIGLTAVEVVSTDTEH